MVDGKKYEHVFGINKVVFNFPEETMLGIVKSMPTRATITVDQNGEKRDFVITRRDYRRMKVWAVRK